MSVSTPFLSPGELSPRQRRDVPRRVYRREAPPVGLWVARTLVVGWAATDNVASLSGTGGAIDGHTIVTGDPVLVPFQTTKSENGAYIVQGGAWKRIELRPYDDVHVDAGDLFASTTWRVASPDDVGEIRHVDGWGVETIGTTHDAKRSRQIILAGGAIAYDVNLPTSPYKGLEIIVKRVDSADVSIVATGGKTIDGSGSITLTSALECGHVLYDGAAWYRI